jgi:hypothetical protein
MIYIIVVRQGVRPWAGAAQPTALPVRAEGESEVSPVSFQLDPQRELRWIADSYEQAQRVRIQAGERIRAILQGRDASPDPDRVACDDPEGVLGEIRRGESDGPSAFLAHVYRLNAGAEEAAQAAMARALPRHPAWPWLSEVRGVGNTLACRLLARLDPVRASRPSGFWAYCGLSTVPGQEYACSTCGRVVSQPISYQVTGTHQRLGGRERCTGALRKRRGPDAGVRVAQPRPGKGERAGYDRQAKRTCHLVCVSFLRCGGPYADWYRQTKAGLEATREGWAPGRIHLTALRKTEKLFLAHLWLVWRDALGLPVTEPNARTDRMRWPGPWEMTRSGAAPCLTAAA